MSIDVQTEIRNTCLYDGGHFAVLMAGADCANTVTGEGIYPGIDLWAANARLKQRRTQDIIQELRADLVLVLQSDDGEDLGPEVQPTGGRGRKTEYRIDLEKVQELQGLHEAEVKAGAVKCAFCEAREKRLQRRALKGAISRTKGANSGANPAKNDAKGAIPGSHIDRTNEPSLEPSGKPPEAEAVKAAGDLFGKVPEPPAPPSPAEILALAYTAYDELAKRHDLQLCQKKTDARDQKLKARLADCGGIDGWRAALEKAEQSDFCMGRAPPGPGRRQFKASLDFLLQESSFVNLMEGKYDNRTGPQSPGPGDSRSIAAGVAAKRAAERANRHAES